MKTVTIKEACEITGLPHRFLRKKIANGEYPALKVGSERETYRVDIEVLQEFLREEQLKNVKSKS
ncbi:excisionase family DNA-binding protein [Aminipila sp.]|uniref:excisionase family DNA-binding protein n=1 Tax=Aminipila sp. TaxID=2060095 RepID=UPI0028A1D4BA|nr:excisionase family DNA-binding protein [Aminipila sp.]